MEYDEGKARGILDKSFPSVKVPFHKDSAYLDVLRKCREVVWGSSGTSDYTYYIADGLGSCIGSSSFKIDLPGGSLKQFHGLLSII